MGAAPFPPKFASGLLWLFVAGIFALLVTAVGMFVFMMGRAAGVL